MDDLSGLLHHVELYVSDLRASTEFWGWFLGELGYVEFQCWEEGISGRLGPTYLVLVQVESRHLWPPYHRSRVGLNHLAFHANSRAQVDEITGALRRRGVGVLYEDRHPHAGGRETYAVFCEDPYRIKAELVAP